MRRQPRMRQLVRALDDGGAELEGLLDGECAASELEAVAKRVVRIEQQQPASSSRAQHAIARVVQRVANRRSGKWRVNEGALDAAADGGLERRALLVKCFLLHDLELGIGGLDEVDGPCPQQRC